MATISLPTLSRKRTPLQIQRAVLVALVIRELRARVEGRWLGLLWMVFEPLAHIFVILALFGFRHHVVSATIEFPVFLVTGMLPFFMFRNLARRLPSSIPQNRGLYAYRQVKPIDALVARAAVEIGLYTAVYFCALAILGWLDYHWLPNEPLELLLVMCVLVALGMSLGLLFSVLVHNRPKVETFIGMLFMPLYLLSGVIFPARSLPAEARQWLLLNPILHLIELGREHFLTNIQPLPGVNLAYPAGFALVVGALALALYRINRHELVSAN